MSAVDGISNQMANASLDAPKGDGAKSSNPAQSPAAIAAAEEGRRLYIGNLAYATTEAQLKEFFQGYLVESVSIPLNPKSTRPVGYAFVDLSTPSEADRAVTELNGKSLTERQVSVQHARKPDAEGEQKTGPRNKRHNLGRHGRHNTHATSEAHNGTTTDGTSQTATNGAAGDATKHTTSDAANKTRKPKPVSVQTQRPKRSLSEGTDSTVKVMIANLPFDITEDKLKDYFKEYQPVAVKIALRPIPKFMAKKLAERGEARKGRGFAFVTLASEEMQQKAIHEKDQGEIDGRTVTVKVAVDMPPQDDASPVTHSPVDGTTTQDATPAATS